MLSSLVLSLSQLALFLFGQEMTGAKTLHFSRLPKVYLIIFPKDFLTEKKNGPGSSLCFSPWDAI